MTNEELILALYEIEGIKFGEYLLKSGITSPIYVDLRMCVSYPNVLRGVSEALWNLIKNLSYDRICGVPYTALPIATAISLYHDKPMVMRRKEVKDYGTRKAIEGAFNKGETCLVIEDMVTSGSSVFETIEPLEHEGLIVSDVAVLLDREQGGRAHIEEKGYALHSVMTISEILGVLAAHGKLPHEKAEEIKLFIREHQV